MTGLSVSAVAEQPQPLGVLSVCTDCQHALNRWQLLVQIQGA